LFSALELWEGGAMVGVIVAIFNYLAAIIIIIYVKKKFPDGEQTKGYKTNETKMEKNWEKQEPVTSK